MVNSSYSTGKCYECCLAHITCNSHRVPSKSKHGHIISGVIGSMLASSVVECVFEPRSGNTLGRSSRVREWLIVPTPLENVMNVLLGNSNTTYLHNFSPHSDTISRFRANCLCFKSLVLTAKRRSSNYQANFIIKILH
jgi:hypothetical protein